ncbi:MAG: flavin reductase [Candidatus Cryptobacteroides sp.]
MRPHALHLLVAATIISGCNIGNQKADSDSTFTDLFTTIDVKDIEEDVFTLIGENYGIITAGTPDNFNSMVTSWGGWGIVFGKPGVFHFLRSNRYTLELMRERQTYTLSFFDNEYKDAVSQFGLKSGRDSDKMKETSLTPVQTPDSNPAFYEAKLNIECRLSEVTTVSQDDFYNDEDRNFVTKAFQETRDWH